MRAALSNPAMEGALRDMAACREFVRLDDGIECDDFSLA
jgi:IS5 family transposase